jgi:imidazolonepropionase
MAKLNADRLIVNAAELLTCSGPREGIRGGALGQIDVLPDGALAILGERIAAVGTTAEISATYTAPEIVDAAGRLVTPGLVDSHSHLLYGGTRHEEYESKVTQRAGALPLDGGIGFTVRKTREASDAMLVGQALRDLDVMLEHGTTTLEAKTGYGLERDDEMRLLRLTAGLRHPLKVVPTFLALHVLPQGYAGRRQAYLDQAIASLPEAAKLAPYCDVSCDPVCFSYEECLEVAQAARALGMKIRVHADQNGDARGALLAAHVHATAADHLDYASDEGLRAMADAGSVATLLPGVTLHMCEMTPRFDGVQLGTAEKPFMPLVARRAVQSGVAVALSTDYNPGSCPTPSMQMVMQLAARLYRLDYAQIWNMCTLNAACALDVAHDRGSLEPGKRADVVIWSVPAHGMVINRFGVNLAETVIASGKIVVRHGCVAPGSRSTAKEVS